MAMIPLLHITLLVMYISKYTSIHLLSIYLSRSPGGPQLHHHGYDPPAAHHSARYVRHHHLRNHWAGALLRDNVKYRLSVCRSVH